MLDAPVITPRRIIGTGNPLDVIFMIPLVAQWHPARACILAQAEGEPACDAPISRIVIVASIEPPDLFAGEGWRNGLAFCEPHFIIVRSQSTEPSTIPPEGIAE